MNDTAEFKTSDMNGFKVIFCELRDALIKKGFCNPNKQYSNLFDLIEELDSEQYLWLRNEHVFKNILSQFSIINTNLIKEQTIIREKSERTYIDLPSPETSLNDVFFNNKFDKLILKIKNSNHSQNHFLITENKLSDIINMTRNGLSGLPGIGKKYIDLWAELKTLYEENYSTHELKPQVEDSSVYDVDFEGMAINFSALSTIEKKKP